MKNSKAWARGLVPLNLILLWLFASGQAMAQMQLHCDGFSAVGGTSSSASNILLAAGGLPYPTEPSSNPNFILNPGFIPCIAIPPAPPCAVEARIRECPPTGRLEIPRGTPFQATIVVDMSGSPAPDDRLGSFTGRLTWNPALLRYSSDSGLQSGFTGVVDRTNASTGTLTYNGANPTGVSGVVNILAVTFEVVGTDSSLGTIDLDFSAMAAAGTFRDLLPGLTARDCDYHIGSPPGKCGDINDDGVVNSTDCLILLSFDVGIPIPPAFQAKINQGFGDLNVDGTTNSTDALICLTCDAGLPQCPSRVGQPGPCR